MKVRLSVPMVNDIVRKDLRTKSSTYNLAGIDIVDQPTHLAAIMTWGENGAAKERATHIVRCVNSHDALLEVLATAESLNHLQHAGVSNEEMAPCVVRFIPTDHQSTRRTRRSREIALSVPCSKGVKMNLKQTHALQLIERSWEAYQSPNPELQTDKGWFPVQDNPADHKPLDVDEAIRRSYHTVIVLGSSKVPWWRKLLRLLKR